MSAPGQMDDSAFEAELQARGYEFVDDEELPAATYTPEELASFETEVDEVEEIRSGIEENTFGDLDPRVAHLFAHVDELERETGQKLDPNERSELAIRVAAGNLTPMEVQLHFARRQHEADQQLAARSRDTSLPKWQQRNARRERMVRAMERGG